MVVISTDTAMEEDDDSEPECQDTDHMIDKQYKIEETEELPSMETVDFDEIHVKSKHFDWLKEVFVSHDK
jgi:hypothetical protein